MNANIPSPAGPSAASPRPFRRAVIRGLAVLCPPLLTVLIFVWAINTTRVYFLTPTTDWARDGLVWYLMDAREGLKLQNPADPHDRTAVDNGRVYHQLDDKQHTFIPQSVYEVVRQQPGVPLPVTAAEYYRRYVDVRFLQPYLTVPFLLAVLILLLYFLGKFMAVGIGRFFASSFDRLIGRLPGVSSVYSAVKQVSDFLFTTRDIQQFNRIVAVEYPRQGIWSLGFVTSEGLASIHDAAGEPVLTVLVPCSPMPVTGCTITVRKSECIDLDLTFDQACQFIVSCGVVVPPPELWHLAAPAEQEEKA